MKTRSLAISAVISAFFCSVCPSFAESPHEIAVRIILSAPTPVHHFSDGIDEELKRALGLHSDARLNQFMLGDSVPEEIRVCYAMHLLVGRLLLARDLSDSKFANDYRNDLRRDYEVLATYLRQLNEQGSQGVR
jgi:hypothetical protein